MKRLTINISLAIIAIAIILTTLFHGYIAEITIFHGMILHPFYVLAGFSLLGYIKERC